MSARRAHPVRGKGEAHLFFTSRSQARGLLSACQADTGDTKGDRHVEAITAASSPRKSQKARQTDPEGSAKRKSRCTEGNSGAPSALARVLRTRNSIGSIHAGRRATGHRATVWIRILAQAESAGSSARRHTFGRDRE